MPANWSLIVNLLLSVSALCVGMGYCLKLFGRFREKRLEIKQWRKSRPGAGGIPSLGTAEGHSPRAESDRSSLCDEIIAVRKVDHSMSPQEAYVRQKQTSHSFSAAKKAESKSKSKGLREQAPGQPKTENRGQPLMMFLLAKENRQLMGYEVLQTILAIGLRFGAGDLFHLYDNAKKAGNTSEMASVLCSLAAATQTGSFDLNNMGAFQAKGLCLFMSISGNAAVDTLRFHALYQTAQQLRDGLDVYVLDDQRRPLTEDSFKHYAVLLNNQAPCQLYASLRTAAT